MTANLPVHPVLGEDFSYEQAVSEFDAALSGEHPAPGALPIVQQVLQLGVLLLRKNAAYGNSALAPLEVFAKDLTPSERMGVRMDDKLSRLSRGTPDGEDVEMDLAGYLVLRRIAEAS